MKLDRQVVLAFTVVSATMLPMASLDMRIFLDDLRYGWDPDAWQATPATLEEWRCKSSSKGFTDRLTIKFKFDAGGREQSVGRAYRVHCNFRFLNPLQGDDLLSLKQEFSRVFFRSGRPWEARPLRPSASRALWSWCTAALGWLGAMIGGYLLGHVMVKSGRSRGAAG